MSEKILLEVILVLVGCLFTMLAFIWRGHDAHHRDIKVAIDKLNAMSSSCEKRFASQEGLKRAWDKLEEHEDGLQGLSNRMTALETVVASGKRTSN